ncbi:MAG: Gfo/Idh/MocA family oxidoreductase [Candidatus Latescibacteria bacterium]|nr:Gfo/Idh/MocA family oxidoreductase [Candidatus Latescibacterota bacterium]
MQSKLQAGIIGFGLAGRNMHYKALVEGLKDKSEVTAVYNRSTIPREGRNENDYPLAESTVLYEDIDRFFEHPGLDIVHITAPSGLHFDFIEKAAQAGLHVICDKPLDVTLERIDRAVRVCKDNNVSLSVSFQKRYNPHVLYLKKAIDEGRLGNIIYGSVECKLYRHPDYYNESAWHGRYDLDGGAALMNQSIHYIDIVQWLMGSPITEVRKGIAERLVHTYIEAEDFGYGELLLTNGAIMTILGGTCFRPGIGEMFEIRGTKGWGVVANGVVTKACWDGRDQTSSFGASETTVGSSSSPALGLENHIRYFREIYDAVIKGKEVPLSGSEARTATEIILGIYKAAETGKPVMFPLESDYEPGS